MANESKQVPETSTAMALDEELWAEHSTQIRTASGQHIITSGNDWLRRYIIEMHNSRLSLSAPSVPSSEVAPAGDAREALEKAVAVAPFGEPFGLNKLPYALFPAVEALMTAYAAPLRSRIEELERGLFCEKNRADSAEAQLTNMGEEFRMLEAQIERLEREARVR